MIFEIDKNVKWLLKTLIALAFISRIQKIVWLEIKWLSGNSHRGVAFPDMNSINSRLLRRGNL